jgi:hypothetical protein
LILLVSQFSESIQNDTKYDIEDDNNDDDEEGEIKDQSWKEFIVSPVNLLQHISNTTTISESNRLFFKLD